MADPSPYDIVIIGSGPGGYVAAIRAGQIGLKTAIIEKEDKFGGTCLHWGCIPTKALLFEAEIYEQFRNAREYGFACEGTRIDWPAILERKNRIVARLSKGVELLLKKNKVEMMRGVGRLAGEGRVSVSGTKGQGQEMRARAIVLATGSEARMLPGIEADGQRVFTHREILSLGAVPRSIVIVGAGAEGVEFASIFSRFGSKVTILEMLPRLVPLEDEEISAELERAYRKQGISIHTGAKVGKTSVNGKGVSVDFATAGGKGQTTEAETLLVAVGRSPNTQGIGLEKTRAELDQGFIKVNEFLETAEPGLYAIGDIVAGSPLLAHVGQMEGIVAVTHAAASLVPGRTFTGAEAINYRQVPNCTYTEPEIASVGLTERQARESGYSVKTGKFPFSANSKAAILGAREGFVKIVNDARYGEIMGVHMIGPRVTEMIAEAVAVMRLEGTVEDLRHIIHPHPTLTEALLEAAHAAADGAIHL